MKNKWKKGLAALCLLIAGSFLSGYLGKSLAEGIPGQEASTLITSGETVLVGGMPVGLYMETEGVLVLNTQSIEDLDGKESEPAKGLVKSGDYITGINGKTISDKEELAEMVSELDNGDVTLQLRRGSEIQEVEVKAVEYEPDQYKLGIWVRDNVQGLGTITYMDSDGDFGALGHGIHDMDTGVLMDVSKGSLYRTGIRSVVKGEAGYPGSMEGVIVYNNYNKLGTIDENTDTGIYGTVEKTEELFQEQDVAEICPKEEIKIGSASVRCSLGNGIKEYDAQIIDVDPHCTEVNKGIIIQITDPELLEQTGGIIQGMSGSPILQDGKLVGAVTHVFVEDPSMGYGIFIENMLEH